MAEDLELFEITEKSRASYDPAAAKAWFFPGEWVLRRRAEGGSGFWKDEFFSSREECELVLAALGLGIGGVGAGFANSVRWELEEVS